MKNNKEKRVGAGLIFVGLMMVLAGALLAAWHFFNTTQLKQTNQDILVQINAIIDGDADAQAGTVSETDQKLKTLYKTHPDVSMPVVYIGDEVYVGRLDLPDSGLSLPVLDIGSDGNAAYSSYRSEGSVYKDNMVIALPNGINDLGNLDNMGAGDRVTFTDMDGNTFVYTVSDVEEVETERTEALQDGDWDLTLYASIYNGRYPLAIHCTRVEDRAETLGAFLLTE